MTDNIQNWQAIRYCDPSIKSTASWSLLIAHLGDSVRLISGKRLWRESDIDHWIGELVYRDLDR